jgi:hypothetical protein
MEASAEDVTTQRLNRRQIPRFSVDEEASLLLVNHGSKIPCRVLDLGMGGCRVYTRDRFQAGILVRIEVNFKVRGLAFRFSGVTQWTDSRHQVGIRFVDVIPRRKDELAEALHEVELELAAKANQESVLEPTEAATEPPVEEPVVALPPKPVHVKKDWRQVDVLPEVLLPESDLVHQDSLPTPDLEDEEVIADLLVGEDTRELSRTAIFSTLPEPAAATRPVIASSPQKQDRRAQSRHEVDTSAVIYLVKIASRIPGRIQDLSESGCRIRTDERFPVGIYTRVEAEFRLEGLPFRLGGVVQAIHDRHNVGIRFLDMSDRKREQVEQLIEEIKDMYGETHKEKHWTDKGEG